MLQRSVKFWCFSMMIVVGVLGFGLVFSGLEPVATPEAEPSIQSSPTEVEQNWFSGVKEYIAEDERKIRRHTSGVLVANTQRGFRGFFSRRGILVVPSGTAVGGEKEAGWRWDFALMEMGRMDRLEELKREEPAFEGHQVSYDLGRGVREVWENRKDGLKQNVWIDRRPGGTGRVVLEGRWGGDVEMRGDRNGVVMSSGGAEVLRFAGLVVRDARGVILPSGMGHSGRRLLFWYRDRDASYPVELDPVLTSPGWSSVGDDQESASFGWSAGTAGDVNGDGYSDIIIGAPGFSTVNSYAGKAYVYHGGASGPSLTPDWESVGDDQADARFGNGAATAGDVDGDGFSDIIIGAATFDSAGVDNGKAYLYLGSSGGVLGTPDWTSSGDDLDNAHYGVQAATAGDVNGDGYSDVIVGAYWHNTAFAGAGKAYVYHGGSGGLSLTEDWSSSGDDNQIGATFGLGVASAGDVNGDGYSDVIVGASTHNTATHTNAGKVYVFHGGSGGLSLTADWTSSGDDNQDGATFGMITSTAGDVNGDGYSDVIVGAHATETANLYAGKAFVYCGSSSGLLDTPIWTSNGDDVAQADYGRYVSTAGDVNGDGFADIIVGARNQDTPTTGAGKAFVYEGGPAGPSTTPVWTSSGDDQDGASFGQSVGTVGDVNGDGFSDIIVGANSFDATNLNAGKVYVYYGSGSGLSTTQDWDRTGGGYFGCSISEAGDVNGDGYSDLIVGSKFFDTAYQDAGRAYVFHGGPSGPSTFWDWDSSGDDNQASANYGAEVSTAGDVNGDGYSDIIVSAPSFDTTVSGAGKAYVYHGGPSGLSTTPSWTSSGDNQDGAGFGGGASTAGDVDGDGYSDVIVGAGSFDASGLNTGKAYLYLGSTSGLSPTEDWSSIGEDQEGAVFGASVGTAGDVDGDGYSDVVVGAPGYDASRTDTGKAYVFHGGPSGPSLTADWESVGEDQRDTDFGTIVTTAGDVDGDGYSDIIVAASGYDSTPSNNEGKVYVYHGGPGGLSLTADWTAVGDDYPGAMFGFGADSAGDVNGDGYSDVIAGAPQFDGSNLDTGKIYLYLGSSSGLDLTPAWTSLGSDLINARLGYSVATGGDVNGDGFSDVFAGAVGEASLGGRVYGFYGGGGGNGLAVAPRQARADGSALVQLLGLTGAADQVRLQLLAHTAAGRTRARLIWEVKPFGTPFDYTGFGVGPWVDTTVTGVEYDQLVGGLMDNTQYHWRVRLQYFPHMNYSMWYSIGPNGPEEADFRTGVVSGCVLHTECPLCQECVTGTCQDQAVGSDVKNECTADACNTGDCDGMGACGYVGAGAPCGDQGVVCHVDDTCDGAGGCTDNGFEADGTSCDDGQYCNGTDACDAAGACQHSGSPCTGAECDNAACNETLDNCHQAAGTACTDNTPDDCYTAACSGTGVCTQSYSPKAEGLPCNDGLYCTETDACNAAGGCVGTGDPCAGGAPCNRTCNEGPQNCFDPNGTSCDNGVYCDGTDTCDSSGNCMSSGDPCVTGPECNNTCNEGDKDCFSPLDAPCGSPSFNQCDNADGCDGTGTCVLNHVANGTHCDDLDPCSDLDTCLNGNCEAGTPNKDTDLDTFIDEACGGLDCDDDLGSVNPNATEGPFGDPTCSDTHDNDCNGMFDGADPGCKECETGPDCDDGNECTTDTCNAGVCDNSPVANGTLCNDGLYCTNPDSCTAGVCGGPLRDCSSMDDQCNNGVCNEGSDQCEKQPKTDGTSCDDGLYCSDPDACSGGACVGPARDCSSVGDQCNSPSCDEVNDVCEPQPLPNGTGCDDGVYCTNPDTCTGGTCGGPARDCSAAANQCNDAFCNEGLAQCEPQPLADGTSCNDGLYCTVTDTCSSGVCTGLNRDCSWAGDQCNSGSCDDGLDQCVAVPAADGTGCDDGTYCTNPDTCTSGTCGGPARDCSFVADQCNDPFCNETGGSCDPQPKPNNTPCDDANACTMDEVCTGGVCGGGAPLDEDGDTYVSDACGGADCDDIDPNVNPGVTEAPFGDPICNDGIDNNCNGLTDTAGNDPGCLICSVDPDCDDGNQCNGTETCVGGGCQPGTAPNCNDSNPCTDDTCIPATGCQNTNNTAPCDDTLFCTLNDQCDAGNCVGTDSPCTVQCMTTCNDTTDSCEPSLDGTPCNDGLYCTENDQCTAGSCGGTTRDCSIMNTDCVWWDCDENSNACVADPSAADGRGCDDGLYCTDSDVCTGGVCEGSPLDCSALSDECNTGRCSEALQRCDQNPFPNGTPCDNGNLCTTSDACVDGICQPGTAINCRDDNYCTFDDCDPASGCVNTVKDEGTSCDDRDLCTHDDICDASGNCAGTPVDCSLQVDACNIGTCNPETGQCDKTPDPSKEGQRCEECRECQGGACRPKEGMECVGCYLCEDGSGLRCTYEGDASGGGPCDSSDQCILAGVCDGQEHCVVEGFCDVEAAGCGRPGVVYGTEDTQTLNCRLGGDRVDVGVEVDPVPGGAGTFVPVRLVLGNRGTGGWTKGLHEIRVIVSLKPQDMPAGGKIAYVIGSAILQGGEKYVEEDINEANNRAVLRLFRPHDPEDTQMMPAGGDWVLDFVVMRGENAEGAFRVDVWAPCESMPEEVGCHPGYDENDLPLKELIGDVDLQRISKPKYVSTSGKVTDNPDEEIIGKLLQSPVMGCQCHAFNGPGSSQGGTEGRGGWGWLVLLLFAAVLRKYRV